jgi:hypothetical protein
VRAKHRHVENGQAVDRDAECLEVMGDQPRAQAGKLPRGQRVIHSQRGERPAGRIFLPVRRAEALNAAALLIDQDGSIVAPDRRAELGHQRAHLIGIGAIAPEQNQPPGIGIAQEGPLVGFEPETGAADDQCMDGHCVS